MKFIFIVLLAFCLFTLSAKGQNIQQFYLYSYDHSLFNPAAAGAENKHVLGLNGRMNYNRKDNNSEIYTGIISYNGHFSRIKSGIGVLGLIDVFGSHTTSKVGVNYNYKMEFAPKISLRVGLRPTISKLSVSNSEEKMAIKPDLDLGLWFEVAEVHLGASLSNTFDHKYSVDFLFGDELDLNGDPTLNSNNEFKLDDAFSEQIFTLIVGKKIKISALQLDPSLAFLKASNDSHFYLNNNFTLKGVFILGGTYIKDVKSNWYNIGINGGFNFKRFQIVGLIYTRSLHRPYIRRDYNFLFEGMMRVKI